MFLDGTTFLSVLGKKKQQLFCLFMQSSYNVPKLHQDVILNSWLALLNDLKLNVSRLFSKLFHWFVNQSLVDL